MELTIIINQKLRQINKRVSMYIDNCKRKQTAGEMHDEYVQVWTKKLLNVSFKK